VVKFFIFIIVFVFDPLAVALIIAFNGLITDKKRKQKEILTEMMKNDQKLGLYEVYGDKKEDLVENNSQNTNFNGKILSKEEETPPIVENILQSEKDAEVFFDSINTPTEPVDALIEAKERYEESLKKKSLKI